MSRPELPRCVLLAYLLRWTQCKQHIFSAKMDFKQVFCMTQQSGTCDDTHPTGSGPDSLPPSPVLAGEGWLCPGSAHTQHPLGPLPALPPDPRHRKMELSPNPLLPLSHQALGGVLVCH